PGHHPRTVVLDRAQPVRRPGQERHSHSVARRLVPQHDRAWCLELPVADGENVIIRGSEGPGSEGPLRSLPRRSLGGGGGRRRLTYFSDFSSATSLTVKSPRA